MFVSGVRFIGDDKMPPKKIWKLEEKEFIYKHFRFENKTLRWIAEQLSTNRQGIAKLIKEEGWKRAYEDSDWLYHNNWVESKTFKEMSELAGCKLDTIRVNFRKFNLDANPRVRYRGVTKYQVNKNYFDSIDTHEKAYWLGFILADGGIEHTNCDSYRLRFNLSATDRQHLENFKLALDSTHPIFENQTWLDVTQKSYDMVSFSLNNSYLCKKLMSYNIFPNKSGNEKPYVNVPIELRNSYLRGYFDGDGSFTHYYSNLRGREVGSFNLIGSLELLKYFSSLLEEEFNIKVPSIRKDGSIYRFDLGSDKFLIELYDWLYTNQEVYLPRKKEAFERYFTLISDIVRSSEENSESQAEMS